MHRRWSAVLTSVIATAAVITGASIVGGEARAGSSDEYVAPASLDCVTPIVVSTTGPTDAESMGGLRFGYGQDMVLTHTMSVALPAGTYEVEASTHDSYSFRADVVAQANEQVRIVASAAGEELAATGFTSDLTDGTFTGWAVSDLGSITLADDADAITIEHFALDHATVGPDSLKVAALCFVPVDGADEADDDDAAGDDAADDAPCPADHDSDDGEDDAGGDADDAATDGADADDADADEAASEDCDEPASDEPLCDAGDDADDDTDEADDDSDDESDPCEDPAAEDPADEVPADEVPVDEDCIVVDQGDDTDFSGTEDCEDVILIEVCDDHAAEEDADDGDDGTEEPGVDEPAHDCDEPVVDDEAGDEAAEDDAADDDSAADEGDDADDPAADDPAADEGDAGDETPDVGGDGSDDSTADDSDDSTTGDDGSGDDGSDDSTSDESTGDEPPAGPTAPADADDPEIPLVDTVPNSSDDDTTDDDTTDGDTTDGADPVQGAVDQQTPGQGGLPVTGATSGILVMLGLSLAIAGFALMGMVGRQYMGGAD